MQGRKPVGAEIEQAVISGLYDAFEAGRELTEADIAKNITSRFLNIISLFNGFLPLVAIQLNAIKIEDGIAMVFTTILDQRLGFAIEEEEEQEVTGVNK